MTVSGQHQNVSQNAVVLWVLVMALWQTIAISDGTVTFYGKNRSLLMHLKKLEDEGQNAHVILLNYMFISKLQ